MSLYAMFNGECPSGWDMLTVDDGRFLYVSKEETLLDACSSITGWIVPYGSVSVNSTTYKEGTSSLNCIKSSTASADYHIYKNTGGFDGTGKYINMWYYVKDSTTLAKINTIEIMLGSPGTAGYYSSVTKGNVGWNLISLKIEDMSQPWAAATLTNLLHIRVDFNTYIQTQLFAAGDLIMDDWCLTSTLGGTGGAETYGHTHSASSSDRKSNAYCGSCLYSSFYYFTTATLDIKPAGIKQVLCKAYDTDSLPQNTILISDEACPTNWEEYTTGDSNYILFTETEAEGGTSVTGSLGGHYHTAGSVSRPASSTGGRNQGAGNSTTNNTISAYTDLYHIKLILCKKTSVYTPVT